MERCPGHVRSASNGDTRRILAGASLARRALTVSRNARVGLATPRTHETISPDAGPQRDHRTSPSANDDLPRSNGRATRLAESAGAERASSPRLATPGITLELALYAVILIAAVLTRFWDLGSRALHHDESLHAYFSWLLATGEGYVHDPLMHGPFLFHFNALIYALFGDSDASSRFGPALFGVILVALPILLRGPRHLGRWGALTASALILISPSLLYQSRYLRHDIFTVAGALFLLIAIVRYVEQPSRGWLIAIGVTVGFLLTNHEIVFGIAAIFVAVIAGALLWGNLRPLAPILFAAGIVAIALVRLPAGCDGPSVAGDSVEPSDAGPAVRLLSATVDQPADDLVAPARGGDDRWLRAGVTAAVRR